MVEEEGTKEGGDGDVAVVVDGNVNGGLNISNGNNNVNGNGNGSANSNGNNNGNNNNNNTNGKIEPTQPPTKEKKTKEEKRKLKKQKKKAKKAQANSDSTEKKESEATPEKLNVEVEYVREDNLIADDPNFAAFADIFARFSKPEELEEATREAEREKKKEKDKEKDKDKDGNNASSEKQPDDKDEKTKKLSKKMRKLQKRLSIAVLKQLASRPEVVEIHDANTNDPAFLISLKSYHNSIPVPKHWSQKRKYLQGKRGVEKPPFELPDFIKATGITRIREALQEKEDQKRLKQKQRERVNPKLHKMDVDYQVLHDAFFKYQTKPKLTAMGDIYYENKEFELVLKEKKPGKLSEELIKALGIPEGAPPPWLINMQRYGPPPSYPSLKIPGLNAPIPSGAQYGYHPGEWGKPPVDEFGRGLYGDVFGTAPTESSARSSEPVDVKLWGELEEAVEEEEEEEGEEDQGELDVEVENEEEGTASVPAGLETPEVLDVRKRRDEERPLFQVLEQQQNRVSGVYGSSYKYVVPGKKAVDVTLQPSEIEELETVGEELLNKKYEKAVSEQDQGVEKEDLSDMVAEHNVKKRKSEDAKSKKKYKDFKF